MFEKSLYDLIRGLRNHTGNERAYIQDCVRECRREIKTEDMDLKATALLKLTYLEMFGHDMSWASFNVLEVMSSPKYPQKRVGYLGAVQSFRPDTEVLMLAENLLKKDLTSPMAPTISLPLIAIPHVISASMANSLLSDLIPRLSHSHPGIRKKTIVTLYRLALVYHETLRPAWPRIKDRLLDENENPSVTAAVINVVCELGWRRPQDFLPLAPRLFDLLVDGTNNWMTIKIIKLFASLIPLEPRLIKKLLPPLTSIMNNTPAMSLLYECINGIIAGGILGHLAGTTEGDDLALLCVNKLRGMLLIENDPNLKYVALLAFNRIAELHPYMVSQHEDAILKCIDGPDISIRFRALELVTNMVNQDNLMPIVDRLMRQLQDASTVSRFQDFTDARRTQIGVSNGNDSDEEDMQQRIRPDPRTDVNIPMPDDYRLGIVQEILSMCAKDTYANINDFDWYIDVLTSLVRYVPSKPSSESGFGITDVRQAPAYVVGTELRNVAIRVRGSRVKATRAAEALISLDRRSQLFPTNLVAGQAVLESAVWIVGEFSSYLVDRKAALTNILHPETARLPAPILCCYVQAAMKIATTSLEDDQQGWSAARKTMTALLLNRLVEFLEPLALHHDLEVQEIAAEFLEVSRLASEASSAHGTSTDEGVYPSAPLLLTNALPSLFRGVELNPVSRDAQHKVPVPDDLDLDKPINNNLSTLLEVPDINEETDAMDEVFNTYFHERPPHKVVIEPAAARLTAAESSFSYQRSSSTENLDPDSPARRRADRRERQRDDPFYIPSEANSGTATPTHVQGTLRTNNGDELDVDSIPIMELDLDGGVESALQSAIGKPNGTVQDRHVDRPRRPKPEVLADEDLGEPGASSVSFTKAGKAVGVPKDVGRKPGSFLQVDSSGLGALSLSDSGTASRNNGRVTQLDIEQREAEEAEMAAAMMEVERLRLEMQRAQERVEAKEESVVVRKKRRKKRIVTLDGEEVEQARDTTEVGIAQTTGKKKRKKAKPIDSLEPQEGEDEASTDNKPENRKTEVDLEPSQTVQKKKKKKRRDVTFDDGNG